MIRKSISTLIRFRYPVAFIVFAVLVLFRVNGSNLAYWSNTIDSAGHDSVVLGHAQAIRSDEYGVLLPVYFSQQNGDEPFAVVNQNITPSGQNVLITMDAPVYDITEIAKPLHWGFFFLDAGHALSWYWNLKLILLFLLSFELAMILTRRNQLISLLGSMWITLSPAVQWWFVQHVGDNVLYFEAIVVSFYYFFQYFESTPRKIGFALLFSLSCIGFVLPLYPALQIPFGFLCLIFMILIFTDYRNKVHFRRRDYLILAGTAVFTLAMLTHLYLLIKDAVPLMNGTVYPGKRVSTGGDAQTFAFYSFLTNPFLPFKQPNIANSNACELSSFYNFLPAVLLSLPALLVKKEKDLKYGISLTVYSVFFALFMAFSFLPEKIARLTLLSYVPGFRSMLVYSFSAMLLSIWALSRLSRGGLSSTYCLAVSIPIAATYFLAADFSALKGFVRLRYYLLLIVFLLLLNYLLLRGNKKPFAVLMAGIIIVSGVTVNPLNIGAGVLLDSKISQEIAATDKADDGALWLGVGDASLGVLIYANGAKSLGGINNYPDMEKWAAIDPDRAYEQIYNRSSHISFALVTTPTTFVLTENNAFQVDLNIGDLRKLKANYIVTSENLSVLSGRYIRFTQLYGRDAKQMTIYKVDYS